MQEKYRGTKEKRIEEKYKGTRQGSMQEKYQANRQEGMQEKQQGPRQVYARKVAKNNHGRREEKYQGNM